MGVFHQGVAIQLLGCSVWSPGCCYVSVVARVFVLYVVARVLYMVAMVLLFVSVFCAVTMVLLCSCYSVLCGHWSVAIGLLDCSI